MSIFSSSSLRMLMSRIPSRSILLSTRSNGVYTEYYPDVKWNLIEVNELDFPPDRRRLQPLKRNPLGASEKVVKDTRRPIDTRGQEEFRNILNYKQFGIQAMEGGELKYGHLEMMRLTINRRLDEKRMFAVWGVESPWKAKTKRSVGKRMGGGKPEVHHYVTPVKAGRIVVEMGGFINWHEAYWLLSRVADKLPFRSRFISQELLDAEDKIDAYIQAHNVNPFANKRFVLANNYVGCHDFVSPYHLDWGSSDLK